jgi:hypothetical protein
MAIFMMVAILMAWCAVAQADQPALDVQLQKPGDTAVVEQEEGSTVIAITSTIGIGRATVTSKDGKWPKNVTLRLRYPAKQAFKTLEGFDVTSSKLQIRTSSGNSNKSPFFLIGDDGQPSRDDVNPSGWLNMEFKPHGEDMDIVFPANLWQGEKKIQIQWIDFYRV